MFLKTKRVLALLMIIVIFSSVIPISASAEVYASDYINSYSAGLSQGSSTGQLILSYDIIGQGIMDKIGVFSITIYKSNGTLYTTIYGSTINGLLKTNTFRAIDDYSFTVATGYSYYCKVKFYAEKNGGYDTRTVQTATVAAPVYP